MGIQRYCRPFQTGNCTSGSCRYRHAVDPSFTRKACVFFAQGRCRKGEDCRYSHEQNDVDLVKAINGLQNGNSVTTINSESLFREFRYKVAQPVRGRATPPLGRTRLGLLFQEGSQLVDQDVGTMQEVVKSLASEGALLRIDELLSQRFEEYTPVIFARTFQDQILPFFQILAHERVTSSIVLRPHLITLYNVLYSSDGCGERAVKLFANLAIYFRPNDGSAFDANLLDAYKTTVAVLARLVEVNTTAHANTAYVPVCQAFVLILAAIPDEHSFTIRKTKKDLEQLEHRLGIGSALPAITDQKRHVKTRATFELTVDLPGELSDEGRRHDNDHASIRDIAIMPTLQEIESSRNEYLPLADPQGWHLRGVEGLVDRHFRLLREDTIGQLRDAAKIELAKLRNQYGTADKHHQGTRTFVYTSVYIAEVDFEEHHGMQIAIGFARPHANRQESKKARESWWEHTKRLRSDGVVCLLDSAGSATFLTVAVEGSMRTKLQKQFDLVSDSEFAYVVLQPVEHEAVGALMDRWIHGFANNEMSLVEFPGVLLPAFVPTLLALKRISATGRLPYAEILAPMEQTEASVDVPVPGYALRPNFRFDLSTITDANQELYFAPGDDQTSMTERLHEISSLDLAQAKAVIHALSHSLSCIQGPPGTGKSFTGVALVRTLLANARIANIGPVVIVTFTNHALDQVLERLHEEGVSNILRIGSRSKSEILEKCNIREVTKRLDLTKAEKNAKWTTNQKLSEEVKQIESILTQLRSYGSPVAVASYLLGHYPYHHQMLFGEEEDADGFQVVRRKGHNPIQTWLESGGYDQWQSRPISELHYLNIHTMSRSERYLLYYTWCADHKNELQEKLAIALAEYRELKDTLDGIRAELDLRVLRDAQVIGLTTSGLARKLDLLRAVNAKVLICEEAGEVVEAHMLTALLPSIEHTILIGDHQQLRPHVQNYSLSMESRNGGQYALDMSLFERLVKPTDILAPALPCSTLQVQRRMHPSISQLVRRTQYPNLEDGPSVARYPEVVGMRQRLFWMHHEQLEDQGHDNAQSTSHTNLFEVDMVASLVRHITQQGVYSPNDVAVITPYLGQLRAIRNKLKGSVAIVLNERDTADLVKEGDDSDEDDSSPEQASPLVTKGTLLEALRIATVDNFQGEEAKVIIVSLVRSNTNNKPGFIRTPNRINVLLSRAQHGMYIIGNAKTTESVEMWRTVLHILREGGNYGDALELCCPRHPETPMLVSRPADFIRLSPEAGCDQLCQERLPCGHACVAKCHSDMLHRAIHCLKPCTRLRKGCDHVCPKACGDKCDRLCQTLIEGLDVKLDCGHTKTSLLCHQYQNPAKIMCEVPVPKKVPGCHHTITMPCWVDVEDLDFKCTAECGTPVQCGHTCRKPCHQCNTRFGAAVGEKNHGSCKEACGRSYTTCKHTCTSPCHPDKQCQPCTRPCDNRCSHAACGKKCAEACAPCLEADCSSGTLCPHNTPCSMPCAAPCDWIPCSKRCDKVLSCGCRCPSVCGETCPDAKFCQNCGNQDIKSLQADLYLLSSYEDVDLDENPCIFLPCEHIFTRESLDGTMGMQEHYNTDPQTGAYTSVKGAVEPFSSTSITLRTCPECRASLRSVARYGRIVSRAVLDESTKRLTSWANTKHTELGIALIDVQSKLKESLEEYRKPNQQVVIEGDINAQVQAIKKLVTKKRYNSLLRLMDQAGQFAHQVSKEEQPFQRVHDLVEHAYRSNDKPTPASRPQYISIEIQPREHLQARNLWFRCLAVLLHDVVSVHKKTPATANACTLRLDLVSERTLCDDIAMEAARTKSSLQQAEALLLWTRFAALECGSASKVYDDEETHEQTARNALIKVALDRLQEVDSICQMQSKSRAARGAENGALSPTDNLLQEVVELRKMFQEGVSVDEMRMVVAVMAKEVGSTGHWYRCVNGHPFTIGECGRPMQLATCPECGEGVGGQRHQATEGVTEAFDIERRFGAMTVRDGR